MVPSLAAAAEDLQQPLDPFEVAGGQEAETCAWPTAVSLRGDGFPFCTGTIVHPRVVLLAAHCIDPEFGWAGPVNVGFGEDGFDPIGDVDTTFCEWHPQWDNGNAEGFDVAYCVLSQAVELDFVPPLMGCEWDAMVPGVEVPIVGFGADVGIFDPVDGWVFTSGNGPKRWAPQFLEGVFDDAAFLLGENAGGCPGDSGGPAMIRMPDGTWRVIGAASRIHPNSPPSDTNGCLFGTVYSTFQHVMPWLEEQSGFDLTPCHDADGTWNPDERCGAMPLAPGNAAVTSGTWQNRCATDELSGFGSLCGPPFEPEAPPPEPPPPEPPPPPPPEPPPPEPPPPQPPPEPPPGDDLPMGTGGSDSGSDDGGGQDGGDGFADRGCSCQAQSTPSGWPSALLLLLPLAWRRRTR